MDAIHVSLGHYIGLSAVLFLMGVLTVALKRNLLVLLMGVELMLNAANLAIIAFSRYNGNPAGHIYVLFIMTVAAAEVVVGLALVLALFRTQKTVLADEAGRLRW